MKREKFTHLFGKEIRAGCLLWVGMSLSPGRCPADSSLEGCPTPALRALPAPPLSVHAGRYRTPFPPSDPRVQHARDSAEQLRPGVNRSQRPAVARPMRSPRHSLNFDGTTPNLTSRPSWTCCRWREQPLWPSACCALVSLFPHSPQTNPSRSRIGFPPGSSDR
jgi:hypothetical protein